MCFTFNETSYDEQVFDGIVCTRNIKNISFVDCVFNGCKFQQIQWQSCLFEDCEFINCDLSLNSFVSVGLRDTKFKECKLLGINWSDLSKPVLTEFDSCIMDQCIFEHLDLRNTSFSNSRLQSAELHQCNLTKTNFSGCNLSHCVFENCDLSHAWFENATNYTINPQTNVLKKAKFSYPEVLSFLHPFDIEIL
jgi:uncharacterized protein YjbI with pentapeptide repeats